MRGPIEAIRKDRAGFMLAGDVWYSLPKGDKLPANIEKGMEVEFDFTKNGTWKNVQGSVTPIGQHGPATMPNNIPPSTYGKIFPVQPDTKDHVIMRQNSLSAAANLFAGKGADVTPEAVLEIAEQFVAWTTGRT